MDRKHQIKKLDKLFSQFIRKRDEKCLICYKMDKLHCAHIFSRKHFNTRWDEDNAVTLCYYHHLHFAHKEPILFAEFVFKYLGKKKYDNLKIRSQTIIKNQDLKVIEIYIKDLIKKIKKGNF